MKSRLDLPRNRASYEIGFGLLAYGDRQGYFDCINRAEYYIWSAIRNHAKPRSTSMERMAERESTKAKARYWLNAARTRKAGAR